MSYKLIATSLVALAVVFASGCSDGDGDNTGTGGKAGADSGAGGGSSGAGGGPVDVDTSYCEPQCEKESRSDCSKKVAKDVCMRRCKTIAEGLATNTDCFDKALALQACTSTKPIVCNDNGTPGYGKEVCKPETGAFTTCLLNRAKDPRCEQVCDARIRPACPKDSFNSPDSRDFCIDVYNISIAFALMSVKCWPKMDAFLECESKSAFTCVKGVSVSSVECVRLGEDYKSCIESENLF